MELETYRFLAMIGFSVIQKYSPVLNKMNKALNALTEDIAATIEDPNRDIEASAVKTFCYCCDR